MNSMAYRRRSYALTALLILIVGLGAGMAIAARRDRGAAQAAVTAQAADLTLLEAWDLHYAEGQRWRRDAALVQLASADDPSDSATPGSDGRRRGWVATFVAPDRRSVLTVRSRGTSIERRDEATAAPGPVPVVGARPQVDSPAALASARAARPSLGPMTEDGKGFHFGLTQADTTTITVLGAVDVARASVRVDAATGAVAGAQQYAAGGNGGMLYSADGGQTWRASNLTGQRVVSVTADPRRSRTAWAVIEGQSRPSIFRTTDGGQTWDRVSDLPSQAGRIPYVITAGMIGATGVLAVGTRTGVWTSSDDGVSWVRMAELPDGPAQFAAFAGSGADAALHVSVTAGPNAGLYRSRTLQSWERLDAARRLSVLDGGESLAAIDESRPEAPPATIRRAGSQVAVSLPPRTMRLAGARGPGAVLFAGGPDSIQRSTDDGRTWQPVLKASLASLAAAPKPAATAVALAGAFRGGIYRSGDNGQTWELVLADPSAVVPGTNVIPAFLFTSDTEVVAIQGGAISWQPLAP